MIVLRSTWLFPLLCAPVFSQFLFVTGSQTPKSTASFGSSLFEFGIDGAIHKIEEIASERAGTSFTEISYDARKMVVLTRNPNSAVVVVDLEKGRVSKRCRQPRVSSVEEWLAEIPSRGLSMIWYSLAQDIDHGIITAMTLDEATPCEKSITNPSPYDSASVVSSGQAGVADIAVNEQVATGMVRSGCCAFPWQAE